MIIAMAVATYMTRLAGFTISTTRIPPWAGAFLRYVPIAAFAALVASGLHGDPGSIESRIAGATVAGIMMLWSRRLWIALVGGMTCYWVVGWLT
jgi:branched-subunit amino acid transport protein